LWSFRATSGRDSAGSWPNACGSGTFHAARAPTALITTIDGAFSSARLTDIGAAVGCLVLAAHGPGLGTCPIGLITAFDDEIKEELNIPEERKVVIGVTVGFRDPEADINRSRTARVALGGVVRWRG
jgi:nitroreductase